MDGMRVVGLDLSLTSTGMSDGRDHRVVQTKPDRPIEERLHRIVSEVNAFTMSADLAVIEDAATSRSGPGHQELSALRLMVRTSLWNWDVPFAMVRPNTLKLIATGNGRASKDEMVAAVDGRHGTNLALLPKSHGRYDLADALALAEAGYDHIGQPLTEWPASPFLGNVDWPELLSDD